MIKPLLLGLIALSGISEAVLPPAWEGVREIKAILDSKDLNLYLDSADSIQSIEREDDGWVINTNRSQINVEIERLQQERPGPEQFEIKFNRKISPVQTGNILR